METFSALLSFCAGNSPVTGEFPAQRPVTRDLMLSLICAWTHDSFNLPSDMKTIWQIMWNRFYTTMASSVTVWLWILPPIFIFKRVWFWGQVLRPISMTANIVIVFLGYTSLGGTARWLQLQPSSAWPRQRKRSKRFSLCTTRITTRSSWDSSAF